MSFNPPPLPVLIIGPAIITWNGYSYYSKTDIKSGLERETFNIETAMDGKIDERNKSQLTKVSFTPVGMLSTAGIAAMFPYTVAMVGSSIFGPTDKPLVIVTKFGGASNTGQTITFPRAALSKMPVLTLDPLNTPYGDVEFTCLCDPTVQPNATNAWNTVADAAFGDTNFDETQIITDTYSAAYGSSPFNAMGAKTGFELTLAMETEQILDDSFGIVDMTLKSLTAMAKFAPNNLSEANYYKLLNGQGTNYISPGQSLSKANTDLVVTGSGNGAKTLTATIKNAGAKRGGTMYGTGQHRLDAVEFTSKRTWTSGAANALWTLAVA